MPGRVAPAVVKVPKKRGRPAKRSRGQATVRDERGRETRASEPSNELFERVDEDQPYIRPTSLDAPKARPGYKQRWVRVTFQGQVDEKNLARKLREGWRARPADSVPKSFHVPRMRTGRFAGTVMVEGMLLCEIPLAMARRRDEAIRAETLNKTKAVNESLMRVNEGARGGFGPIRKGERSQLVREVKHAKDADAVADEAEEVEL